LTREPDLDDRGSSGPLSSSTPRPLDRLPAGVASALKKLRPVLPDGLYLAGGTALALRLGHRTSKDLDFFFHGSAGNIDQLEAMLLGLGAVVEARGPGTLRGYLSTTKVEFFQDDLGAPLRQLEEPERIADVSVAGMKDLMAMKLKVLAERGELRDYYDVKCIDEDGVVSLEAGVALFLERYGLDRASDALSHLVRAFGYLDDVDEDESLPMSKAALARWWQVRQARFLRNVGTR
jgi:hypothetical protein